MGEVTMSARRASVTPAKPEDHREILLLGMLSDMHKALKAISFYPPGHPQRNECLKNAFSALKEALGDTRLTLMVSRTGFSVPPGTGFPTANTMVLALSREFFLRKVKQITFLPEVSMADFQNVLEVLVLEPQKTFEEGGIETLMIKAGISGIEVNEFRLSTLGEKHPRPAVDAGSDSSGYTAPPEGETRYVDVMIAGSPDPPELPLVRLLELLAREDDDEKYSQLARAISQRAEELKTTRDYADVMPTLSILIQQTTSPSRNDFQRKCTVSAIETICSGGMLDFLVAQLEFRESPHLGLVYNLFGFLGEKGALIITRKLCAIDDLFSRKSMAVALKRIGNAALPSVISLLRDERWYVVRNMISLLGDIGSTDCLAHLSRAINHTDTRVRKETVRSLAKIGGHECEQILIGLLNDKDPAIVLKAITALKECRSRQAVQPLIELVSARDPFFKQLELKKEALRAIGRIGDRRATPHLSGLLALNKWFGGKKWEELKIETAEALGRLGDQKALPALRRGASGSGRLAAVSREAINSIEHLLENDDD
jgi:hypothetical protein